MIDIIHTRMLHMKKQIVPITFWLLFPLLSTLLFIFIADHIQEDSTIPIGVVLEEESPSAIKLVQSLEDTPFVKIEYLTEQEAQKKVENHEIDSAFVIKKGYGENILEGRRNGLLTSYHSNLSFAYPSIREKLVSYVQEEAGKIKAIQTVHQLDNGGTFSQEDIAQKIEEIRVNEDLLHQSFSFAGASQTASENSSGIWNPWEVWAIVAILSTMMLFDWSIKERQGNILTRFLFIRFSQKDYFLQHLFVYLFVLLITDVVTISIFYFVFQETLTPLSITNIILYRLFLTLGIFLFTFCFQKPFTYYSISFAMILIVAITSGLFIPLDGLYHLTYINPVTIFVEQRVIYLAGIVCIFSIIIMKWKGRSFHA